VSLPHLGLLRQPASLDRTSMRPNPHIPQVTTDDLLAWPFVGGRLSSWPDPLRGPTDTLTQTTLGQEGGLRPAGASRGHAARQLHAMAPGRMGQTIERAEGHYRQHAVDQLPAPAAAPRPVDNLCGAGYGQ
jgi:hypothetical protein